MTGHTGFKGSWLSLWLQDMGVDLTGFALPPDTDPALFAEAAVADGMDSRFGDIRDLDAVCKAIADCGPDIVIHMAAQPLVRESYENPVDTYATNVMGTVNVLEAVRQAGSVRAVVNVTTDKCYENREWVWGYRETDPMGGHDPYSSSKGCAELVAAAYRRSFLDADGINLASARAGNVIGGGDWAKDRLIPDILKAFAADEPVIIRNPSATRPWQHVLEPLSGYLLLAQNLYEAADFADGWNFGPRDEDAKPVGWIVEKMADMWSGAAEWSIDQAANPHEAQLLKLDISKAEAKLGWRPRWNLERALRETIDWHEALLQGSDIRSTCLQQIKAYEAS